MINVTRLPKDPGPAAWNDILPRQAPACPLDTTLTADWLVIGAGFAGLAAARRLTQLCPGDRIVVLDATRVGAGPAGRNSGFMIDLPHDLSSADYAGGEAKDRVQITENRLAIQFAQDMASDFDLPAEAFARSGKVNAAATPRGSAHNRHYAAHLDKLGEANTWLDAGAMAELTGSRYYTSGLFTPGTAMIQPAMFVRGIADGLRACGVAIHEDSPVVSLDRRTNWVAKTPGGHVTAPRVILAVNGHLNSFGFLPRRLLHIFTYASLTRRLSAEEVTRLGGAADWALTPADPMGTTVRRLSGTGGERIVIRNRFTCDPSMEVQKSRLTTIAKGHMRAFAARFPMLPDVDMAYSWGGRLCLSRENVQVIRAVDDGLYAACCQNGLGTARGTFAGIRAAELATGHLNVPIDTPLPRRLPPAPLTQLGATLHLRWAEMRAGREV